VLALLRALLELCLLRRGPQDLPYSLGATIGAVVALVTVQLAFAQHQGAPEAALSARVMVTLVMLLGVAPVLIERRGFANRVMQTLLALAGSALVFSLLMLPMAFRLQPWLESEDPSQAALGLSLVFVFLFVWKLRVEAAIWRQALEISTTRAYLLTVALMVAEVMLLFFLMPAPVAGPAPVPAAG
jgi:hypothetical protein